MLPLGECWRDFEVAEDSLTVPAHHSYWARPRNQVILESNHFGRAFALLTKF